MGWPHWTLLPAHSRQIFRHSFAVPAAAAGSVSRPVLSVTRDLPRVRMARHHDQELGDGAIRAPELLSVDDVGRPVRCPLRGRREPCRVGADVFLGESEGRDRPRRQPREVSPLLIGGPEQLQRLRNADRLVSRQQRGDVAVHAADHLHDASVLNLVEPEPAVLLGDLHPESTELPQSVDDIGGDLPLAVDPVGVDVLPKEPNEPVAEVEVFL